VGSKFLGSWVWPNWGVFCKGVGGGCRGEISEGEQKGKKEKTNKKN